jgi:hypothetical protein
MAALTLNIAAPLQIQIPTSLPTHPTQPPKYESDPASIIMPVNVRGTLSYQWSVSGFQNQHINTPGGTSSATCVVSALINNSTDSASGQTTILTLTVIDSFTKQSATSNACSITWP